MADGIDREQKGVVVVRHAGGSVSLHFPLMRVLSSWAGHMAIELLPGLPGVAVHTPSGIRRWPVSQQKTLDPLLDLDSVMTYFGEDASVACDIPLKHR